jgi:hypothetical protein
MILFLYSRAKRSDRATTHFLHRQPLAGAAIDLTGWTPFTATPAAIPYQKAA